MYEADASGKPMGESIVDEKLINASDVNDGRFSVTLNIPGSKLDASKKYVAVAATVSAEAGMHAETPLTVKPADQKPDVKPTPNTPLYKDVNQNTAFYAEIQWLGSQNITTGYPMVRSVLVRMLSVLRWLRISTVWLVLPRLLCRGVSV